MLENIAFRYARSERYVLDGISLRIEPGEVVAVMAPSGAGKSTLLGVAGLLLAPENGIVQIAGRRRTVSDGPNLLGSTITFVLQSVNLLPRRTVLDNVSLPAIIAGDRRRNADDRARRLAADLGIAAYLDRAARHLSGGEAQRVGIARALITEPALLLADEPTANLDLETARTVAQRLLATDRGKTATLLATHDQQVAAMADRTLALDELRQGRRRTR